MEGCSREMPRYRCHKEVWALKIAEVTYDQPPVQGEPQGNAIIAPCEDGYAHFMVTAQWAKIHRPQPGGYYVVYKDGYASYSPAKAFEEGYALID